jgi:hypothetical protein
MGRISWRLCGLAAMAWMAVGCGRNECKLDDPSSCPSEQVCEPVTGREQPMCFAPVQVQGQVVDIASGAAVSGAQVAALDPSGSPVGSVAVSDADGQYTLRVPSTRTDEKGAFEAIKLTLRSAASGYAVFPSGVRLSLPIDTAGAASEATGEPWVLSGELTRIGLAALPESERGRPSISGEVELQVGQRGVMVVAEVAGQPGVSAIADSAGAFTLFNVAPGAVKIAAYSKGQSYTRSDLTLNAGQNASGVKLMLTGAAAAKATGTIQMVAGANGAGTSVVLIVKSTFREALARGESPPGFRAPETGVPNLTGAFEIAGVPEGEYLVLAAFENDGNVRDPDPSISGTQIQQLTVTGNTASALGGFKVTGAVELISPDALAGVDPVPTFAWKPYSSAKSFSLTVVDGFGVPVHQWNLLTADIPKGSTNVEAKYPAGAPALTPGRTYQWRATARDGVGNPISLTEDLRGLFVVRAP